MTAVQHRIGQHRSHGGGNESVAHVAHLGEHSPEVLLALAALLIVVAGPVLSAFAPASVLTSAAALLLLVAGLVLAVSAAARLLRS